MLFSNLMEYLKKYRTYKNKKNQTIGSVLKHHRLQRSWTLDDVSDGICSVSYLSKVENNVMNPTPNYLMKLMEKLSIPEDEINPKESVGWIELLIDDLSLVNSIYKEYEKDNSYRQKLLDFCHSSYNNSTDLYDKYVELVKYINNFTDLELEFFIYVFAYTLYNKEKYQESLKSVEQLLVMTQNKNLQAQANKIKLFSLYKLGRQKEYNLQFEDILILFINLGLHEEATSIVIKNLIYQARVLEREELEDKIKDMKKVGEIEYNEIWLNYYFYNKKDYKKALEYSKKLYTKDSRNYLIHLKTLDKLNMKDEINNVLKNKQNKNTAISYDVLTEYVYNKHQKKNNIEFFRNYLLVNKHVTDDIALVDYLYTEAIKVFKNNQLYKEATKLSEKHTNKIKKLANIAI